MADEDIEIINDADEALRKAAFGGEYKTMRVTKGHIAGVNQDEQMIEKTEVAPNATLLKEVLAARIGGPQDYC